MPDLVYSIGMSTSDVFQSSRSLENIFPSHRIFPVVFIACIVHFGFGPHTVLFLKSLLHKSRRFTETRSCWEAGQQPKPWWFHRRKN